MGDQKHEDMYVDINVDVDILVDGSKKGNVEERAPRRGCGLLDAGRGHQVTCKF